MRKSGIYWKYILLLTSIFLMHTAPCLAERHKPFFAAYDDYYELWQNNKEKSKTLAEILDEVHTVFKVDLLYETKKIPTEKVVFDIHQYSNVEILLQTLLKPFGLQPKKISSNTYAIIDSVNAGSANSNNTDYSVQNTANEGKNKNSGFSDSTGKKLVSGKITDAKTNAALPRVSVTIKGSKNGAYSNDSGYFSLVMSNTNETLVFSSVGYEGKELVPGNLDLLSVSLLSTSQTLNEVVVVGYGTKKRKEVTSSISSVSGKDINNLPVSDAAQALEGKVSGVVITQGSGAPGGTGGTQIRIRGISSITGTNNPLIVIDGFPLPDQNADNVLNSYNVNEIESIDVLKDASAASIYGVRGSNGVIMITTKRGKAGKSVINVDVYRGIQKAWFLPSMLNAREYAVLNDEARIASNLPVIPKLSDPDAIEQQYGAGTDWLGEIFRYAATQNVVMNISGGSDKAQFAISGNYFKQDGILYNTDFERFNIRFNGDLQVSKRFKVGNSFTVSKTIEHGKDTYSAFNSILLLALTSPPTIKPYNPDGSYAGGTAEDGFSEPNPVYNLEVPQFTNTKYRLTGNIFAEYEIAKGLKFKGNFGGDMVVQRLNGYSPATPSTGGRPITITGVFEQATISPSYLGELTLNYDHIFGDHKFGALIGYTASEDNYYNLGGGRGGYTRLGFPVLDDNIFFPTSINQTFNYDSYGRSRLISYVSRVNYDYKSKYLFTASLRRDGSSNFGPNNRYALFPSLSGAWRISEESFMQNIKFVSDLKLRGSFGYTGNQNVGGFAYLSRINTSIQYPLGDNSGSGGATSGAAPTATANPDLKWEKNEQADIGLDASFLKNKLTLALDLYVRKSIDLIFFVNPPTVSGTYEPIPLNTGNMKNKGVDLSLNSTNFSGKNFTWKSTVILSAFKNTVTSLGKSGPIYNTFPRIQGGALGVNVGYPAFYFYGFQTEGIFQNVKEIQDHAIQVSGTDKATSTAPGDIKFKDLNGDGIINDMDRTNLGNSYPTFTYGFTNNFSYKNIELSIFLQGSQGNKVLNFTRWYTEGGVSNGNYSRDVITRWTGEGTSNTMPRVILNDPNQNNRVSDRFVEDASYLRIKNIRIAYTLPAKWSGYAGIKKLQIYGSAQNLLTLTNYKGMDPEVGNGVDFGFYPQARTFLIGINIDL